MYRSHKSQEKFIGIFELTQDLEAIKTACISKQWQAVGYLDTEETFGRVDVQSSSPSANYNTRKSYFKH